MQRLIPGIVYLLLGVGSLFLWVSCEHCPPMNDEYVDQGLLPDSILQAIPYKDGEVVYLVYNDAVVVPFHLRRKTATTLDYYSEECNTIITKYQYDWTKLISGPDIFNIEFSTSNLHGYRYMLISFGPNTQELPITVYERQFHDIVDTMVIYGKEYYDVIPLNFPIRQNSKYFPDKVQLDSMYYNYEFGVLKLKLNSGLCLHRLP